MEGGYLRVDGQMTEESSGPYLLAVQTHRGTDNYDFFLYGVANEQKCPIVAARRVIGYTSQGRDVSYWELYSFRFDHYCRMTSLDRVVEMAHKEWIEFCRDLGQGFTTIPIARKE